MTITIGAIRFDHVEYDADADVLYLWVGEQRLPAESYGTPEGHNVRYADDGSVIGVTLVNARWLVERDGERQITIPSRVSGETLSPALTGN
jgi:uncharacterized protein YuzE